MSRRATYLAKLHNIELDKAAWYALLKDKTVAQLRYQPTPEQWSVFHILDHVILTEEIILEYCSKKIQSTKLKKVSGMTSINMWLMQFVVNQRFFKYKAPKIVLPRELSPDTTLESMFSRWEKVRKAWYEFLLHLPEDKLNKEVYKQPFTGRLGWYGTMVFFKSHLRRHMRQMERVLRTQLLAPSL